MQNVALCIALTFYPCYYLHEKEGEYMNNFKNPMTKKILIIALACAITLILNRLIPALPYIHVTLDFLPVFLVAVLYGPLWSTLTYALADTLGSILLPYGPYNPIVTVFIALTGLILGLVFYKKDLSGSKIVVRSIVASIIIFIVRLFGITFALWVYAAAGDAYYGLIVARLPFCAISAVVMAILIPITYKLLYKQIKKISQ